MNLRRGFFSALFATLIFSLTYGSAFAAFGVSPPFVNALHLVPGSTYTQTIYLVQDDASADVPISVTLNVPDHIKSWIAIDKGMNFVIPAGTQQFPVNITISVPQGEGLGSYTGNMIFATTPGQSGQVAISLGANVSINVVVGNGVFEQYSIPYITLPSIEEGWDPRVTFRFQNSGNVAESIDSATFDLYDQYDAVRLAYMTKSDGFPTTPPFTTQEYTIEFPTDFHLGVGDYWGIVNFYKNGQVIGSQKTVFHVLPPGSLSSPFVAFLESVQEYWLYYSLGLIVLLLIAHRIWIIFSRRKKMRNA